MTYQTRRVLAGGLVVLATVLLRSEFGSVLGFFLGLSPSRWFPGYALALGLLLLVMVTAVSALKYLRPHALWPACGLLFCLPCVSCVSSEGRAAKPVHLPDLWPVTTWTHVQLCA